MRMLARETVGNDLSVFEACLNSWKKARPKALEKPSILRVLELCIEVCHIPVLPVRLVGQDVAMDQQDTEEVGQDHRAIDIR